jgi:hypothetical protein
MDNVNVNDAIDPKVPSKIFLMLEMYNYPIMFHKFAHNSTNNWVISLHICSSFSPLSALMVLVVLKNEVIRIAPAVQTFDGLSEKCTTFII